VGSRGIRIEADCAPKRRDRLLGSPFHHGPISEPDVSPGIAVIKRDRPNGVLVASEQLLIAVNQAHVCGKHQAKPQQELRAGA
jgi:hypothetical protein